MVNLDKQWRTQLELVTENLVRGEREHLEIASLFEQIETDYHGRFLVELVQNANDQTVSEEETSAELAIVRTDGLIAVLNQGAPFDEHGLRDITSIGLSSKAPETCLGNKGVGFKAVFEVCDSPEVFSAPRREASFLDPGGTRFRLDLDPFSEPDFGSRARELASEIVSDIGSDLTVDSVLTEARRAAPFKFPLRLSRDDLDARLSELDISPDFARRFQTMVALPLRDDDGVTKAVDDALDELVYERGATVLFLDGIGRIEVRDHHHGVWCKIGCSEADSVQPLAGGGRIQRVRTWMSREEGRSGPAELPDDGPGDTTAWWVVRRNVGSPTGENADASGEERGRLRRAAKELPGETWQDVESVPVAVALPARSESDEPGSPIGPDGRLCIGLPTDEPTGTPLWLHAHFHGNISRTQIDLESQEYNSILFEEALELFATLLVYLRKSPSIDERRLATLALETDTGPVADAIFTDPEIGRTAILASDGESFVAPDEVALPRPEDVEMIRRLTQIDSTSDIDIVLPEKALLENGRPVLEALIGGGEDDEERKALFLKRGDDGQSLLETGVRRHRAAGPEFWESFLEWAEERFPLEALRDQRILPVGSTELRSPADRVFFKPSGDSDLFEETSLPEFSQASPDLPFFDEGAAPVRTDDGNYTDLARKLAPDTGEGLIRRPEALELINDALVPYLEQAIESSADRTAARSVLRTILMLSDRITSAERRDRIHAGRIRVPVTSIDGGIRWYSASDAYFGHGWVDDNTDALLEEAYGGQGRRLVPWPQFEKELEAQDARSTWVRRMTNIGVSASPKLETPSGSRPAPLKSYSRDRLAKKRSVPPPFPQLAEEWDAYLEDIRHHSVSTKSKQPFDVENVVWVDGLERPQARAAVVRLLLRKPGEYLDATETILGRADLRKDRTPVPTLWVHALRNSEWDVVPTTDGLTRPSEVWLAPSGPSFGRDRHRFLPVASESFRSREAGTLLEKIGARSLDQAGVGDLVHGLHQLAERLDELDRDEERSAKALVRDLYGNLQVALERPDGGDDFAPIDDHPVPLLREGLEAVDLQTVEVVYLDDDPIRSRFVPGLEESPRIPSRAGRSYGALVGALKKVVGEDRIVRTSSAPVETGFEPTSEDASDLLRERLEATFSDLSIQLHLAAVLSYLGRDPLDPEGEEFHRLWSEFQRTRLQRGTFPPTAPDTGAFLDRSDSDDPVLQLSVEASEAKMLEAVWQLFGRRRRDTIALYAEHAKRGADAVKTFFRERNVGQEDLRNLRDVVEGAAAEEMGRARALALILARRRNPDLSSMDFREAWDPEEAVEDGGEHPLGVTAEELRPFARALLRRDETAVVDHLDSHDVSVEEWQAAREALGEEPWTFDTTAQLFSEERDRLAAEIMALTARRRSVDPATSREFVEELQNADVPAGLLRNAASRSRCREAALRKAYSVTPDSKSGGADLLRRRLNGELREGESFRPNDVPDREVTDYERNPEEWRQKHSRERLEKILEVGSLVAQSNDEEIDAERVRSDPAVRELTKGWLASHLALAPLLREHLADQAPETTRTLVEAGAFSRSVPKPELVESIPGIDLDDSERPEKRESFEVFGESWSDVDIERDLASASTGNIGQSLREAASEQVDLRDLADRKREQVTSELSGNDAPGSSGSGGGGGSGDHRRSRRAKALNGFLGEAFVFEHLRQVLPDFDSACWVSENRTRYGLDEPGSDTEGFDFRYIDREGVLASSPGSTCEIEVKATSDARPEEFNLSQPEMNRARACHGDDDREYLIILVGRVRDGPAILDVIRDPVALWERRQLDITWHDLRVRLPPRGDDE